MIIERNSQVRREAGMHKLAGAVRGVEGLNASYRTSGGKFEKMNGFNQETDET